MEKKKLILFGKSPKGKVIHQMIDGLARCDKKIKVEDVPFNKETICKKCFQFKDVIEANKLIEETITEVNKSIEETITNKKTKPKEQEPTKKKNVSKVIKKKNKKPDEAVKPKERVKESKPKEINNEIKDEVENEIKDEIKDEIKEKTKREIHYDLTDWKSKFKILKTENITSLNMFSTTITTNGVNIVHNKTGIVFFNNIDKETSTLMLSLLNIIQRPFIRDDKKGRYFDSNFVSICTDIMKVSHRILNNNKLNMTEKRKEKEEKELNEKVNLENLEFKKRRKIKLDTEPEIETKIKRRKEKSKKGKSEIKQEVKADDIKKSKKDGFGFIREKINSFTIELISNGTEKEVIQKTLIKKYGFSEKKAIRKIKKVIKKVEEKGFKVSEKDNIFTVK